MTKDEALKLALEAMEGADNIDVDMQAAIVRCREALAQPEERNFCSRCGKRTADLTTVHTCTPPLPVQPADLHNRLADLHLYEEIAEHYAKCAISPEALRDWVAERPWVGLTEEEIEDSYNSDYKLQTKVIQAKLKAKNT